MGAADTVMAAGLVDGGGLALHVTETGSGPPLVWLHGSGPASTATGTFSERLGAFAGFRNLLIDLPGFGSSEKADVGGPLIAHAAEHLGAALDTLGIARTSFVANSYGGGVAFKLAAERPELVDRIVAVAPGGAFPEGWTPTEALKIGSAYMAAPEPSRELMQAMFRTAVYDKALITDHLIDDKMAIAEHSHPELPVPPDFGDLKPDLPRVRARTLVLWGREDECLGLDVALVVARGVPDCELRVIPRCGHWVHADQPELFDQTVLEFMEADR